MDHFYQLDPDSTSASVDSCWFLDFIEFLIQESGFINLIFL